MLELGVISAVFLAYALVSRALLWANISAPMVFVAAGILCGPSVLGFASFSPAGEIGLVVAEVALVIVLFSDASRSDLGELREDGALPARLLAIGMPLTMMTGTVAAAVLLLGLDFWEAAVIAAILAPTDAALGHSVISSRLVPEKIRQTINVEAGLNDGLSIPFLFLFLGLAVDQASLDAAGWFTFGVEQIAIGAVTGFVIGGGAGWLVDWAIKRKAMTHTFKRLSLVAIAIGVWALADTAGGNGFIAAFVAGLAVARFREDFGDRMLSFAEREGQLLSLVVFFVFGTVAIGYLGEATWGVVAFSALALTLVRMGPVAIALSGTGLSMGSVAFIGWFGPRGLASIVLALVVLEEEPGLPGLDLIIAATVLTVLASVFLHGITARPFSRLYSENLKDLPLDAPDLEEAGEVRPRRI
jgi:NhaP-type Na+/H+ or K+/H+ antiporter